MGMSESRLRIIVACGAAGGIAATFNAPLTGLLALWGECSGASAWSAAIGALL